jgi:septal ring factor EnvC (AmiA/AmiB activator)
MNALRLLSCGFPFLLASCAATGDWEEDSLFFSDQMGGQRLAGMRMQLDGIRSQTAQYRQKATGLERTVATASASRHTTETEVRQIRAEIDRLEQDLENQRRSLRRIDSTNSGFADRVHGLETDVSVQQLRISRLRAQLAWAISTR